MPDNGLAFSSDVNTFSMTFRITIHAYPDHTRGELTGRIVRTGLQHGATAFTRCADHDFETLRFTFPNDTVWEAALAALANLTK